MTSSGNKPVLENFFERVTCLEGDGEHIFKNYSDGELKERIAYWESGKGSSVVTKDLDQRVLASLYEEQERRVVEHLRGWSQPS